MSSIYACAPDEGYGVGSVILENDHGLVAEITPEHARDLAEALRQSADDAERANEDGGGS